MEIRERRDVDIDQLVAIAARVHAADRYPAYLPNGDFTRFLSRPTPRAAWVAVRNDAIIGHVALNAETSQPVMRLVATLSTEKSAVYVARLLVDPGARREGVGRRLLEHARRAAVETGHLPVLDVVETPSSSSVDRRSRRNRRLGGFANRVGARHGSRPAASAADERTATARSSLRFMPPPDRVPEPASRNPPNIRHSAVAPDR